MALNEAVASFSSNPDFLTFGNITLSSFQILSSVNTTQTVPNGILTNIAPYANSGPISVIFLRGIFDVIPPYEILLNFYIQEIGTYKVSSVYFEPDQKRFLAYPNRLQKLFGINYTTNEFFLIFAFEFPAVQLGIANLFLQTNIDLTLENIQVMSSYSASPYSFVLSKKNFVNLPLAKPGSSC